MGPLFGAVLARAIDEEWARCGRPEVWVVAEAGAGSGTLAAAVLAAEPTCAPALRYLLVERSGLLRAAAAERLPVESPPLVLGPAGAPGGGPLLGVLSELPAQRFTGMVVANELLDNLAFDLFEWRAGSWWEVRVGADRDRPVEVVVPALGGDAAEAARLAGPDPPVGARIPLQRGARAWLAHALGLVERGRVVAIDYGVSTTAELARRPSQEWLRTYRAHGQGAAPLEVPGAQDVTTEVAVDQLCGVRPPSIRRRQAQWLAAHGLGVLVDAARAAWLAAAARPGLDALAAQSRVHEGPVLTDQSGLGRFWVLEWVIA